MEGNLREPSAASIIADYSSLRSPPRQDIESEHTDSGCSIHVLLLFILVACVAAVVYIMLPQPSIELIYLSPGEQILDSLSGFWFDSAQLELTGQSNATAFISHRPPVKSITRKYEASYNLSIADNYVYQTHYLRAGSHYHTTLAFDSSISFIVISSLPAYSKWRLDGYILSENVMLQGTFTNSGSFNFTAAQSDYYFIIIYTPYSVILTGRVDVAIGYMQVRFDIPFTKIDLSTTQTIALNQQLNTYIIIQSTSSHPQQWLKPHSTLLNATQRISLATHARQGTFIIWWPMWTLTALAGLVVFVSSLTGCFVIAQSFGVNGCGCEDEDDNEERRPLLTGEDGEPLPLYEAQRAASITNSCPSYHSREETDALIDVDESYSVETEQDAVSLHTMLNLPPTYNRENNT